MEFGQTPKQLFTRPHPARFSTPVVPVEITTPVQDVSVKETDIEDTTPVIEEEEQFEEETDTAGE